MPGRDKVRRFPCAGVSPQGAKRGSVRRFYGTTNAHNANTKEMRKMLDMMSELTP